MFNRLIKNPGHAGANSLSRHTFLDDHFFAATRMGRLWPTAFLLMTLGCAIQAPTAGAQTLGALYCANNAMLGSGTDVCTALLQRTVSTAVVVNLSSNAAAVAVPSTITIPSGSQSATFTASVSAVTSLENTVLTATLGSSSLNYNLTLKAATEVIALSPTSMNLGTVAVGKAAQQTLYITSLGTVPVTINSVTASGAGFSVSGATFPLTLGTSTRMTLQVQFDPTAAGTVAGHLTLLSNATSGGTTTVSLSGTRQEGVVSALSCASTLILGAATDTCTVRLNGAAPSGGVTVSLSSNNSAATVPATVKVAAGATSAQFTASATAVSTNQTAVLTASTSGISASCSLTLEQATTTLLLSTSKVVFPGNVTVNTTKTEPITIISSGTLPLTISAATITGTGFELTGSSFPVTLKRAQSLALEAVFTPTVSGSAAGQITFVSNDSSGAAKVVTLSGTGSKVGAFSGSTVASIYTPPNPTTAITDDFFGMTIYNIAPWNAGQVGGVVSFPPYKLATLRLWDVAYWAQLEPAKGWFNWTKMDDTIAVGTQNGVNDFIFTMGQTPKWASSDSTDPCTGGEGAGTCSAPTMSDYDAFATTVVQRYCGKVKYYEPWNEPNNPGFWDGTNAQMLTISQHLYQIAKDPANCGCTNGVCSAGGGVNPNKVLLPPIAGVLPSAVTWLDMYLASAGTASYPYADVAAFHGYVWHGYTPETILSEIQNLKTTLAKYGLSNLELWNTETSFESDTYFDDNGQTSWLMRAHIADNLAGVSRLVWYTYDSCSWGTLAKPASASATCSNQYGSTDYQLTQAGSAYSTIEDWMIGASLTQCQEYEDGLWACELQRSNNYDAWMLWSSAGTSLTVSIPTDLNLTVYRDSTNTVNALPAQLTITELPVLLETSDL